MRKHLGAWTLAAVIFWPSVQTQAQRMSVQPPPRYFPPPQPLSPSDQYPMRKRPPRDNCPALQMLNEVALGEAANGLVTVPVKVNGQGMEFILDLTAEISLISLAGVEKAKISTRSIPEYSWVTDATKHQLLKRTVSKFEMGQLKVDEWAMAVSAYLAGDGILGGDFVDPSNLDLDIDFSANRLRTYSVYHCPGSGVYWQAPDMGQVALMRDLFSDINFHLQAKLDGQSIFATIDTGAARSSIRDEVALKLFHLVPPADKAHAFGKLAIGEFIIANPVLDVSAGRLAVQDRAQHNTIITRFHYPDLVIGMDLLRQMHLYFAFEEGKLYVSSASQPATAAATPPTAIQ